MLLCPVLPEEGDILPKTILKNITPIKIVDNIFRTKGVVLAEGLEHVHGQSVGAWRCQFQMEAVTIGLLRLCDDLRVLMRPDESCH